MKNNKNFKMDVMYYLILEVDWEGIRKTLGEKSNPDGNEFEFSILLNQRNSLIQLWDGVP